MSKRLNLFEQTIVKMHGKRGEQWLADLPSLVEKSAMHWNLSQLQPMNNLSYNYVLSGLQSKRPIVVKLGFDAVALQREADALRSLKGQGAIEVIDAHYGALLLERASPGITLKEYSLHRAEEVLIIASSVIKILHEAPVLPLSSNGMFPHINDWLVLIDKDWDIPGHYLEKARMVKRRLLGTSSLFVLLHGDLHHDNILQHNEGWVFIDPKGVVGESTYELACFINNSLPKELASDDLLNILVRWITYFANQFDVDPKRLQDWCFLQVVLAWVWALEDATEHDFFMQLTEVLYQGVV